LPPSKEELRQQSAPPFIEEDEMDARIERIFQP
jgi:hypothetical protein